MEIGCRQGTTDTGGDWEAHANEFGSAPDGPLPRDTAVHLQAELFRVAIALTMYSASLSTPWIIVDDSEYRK
jgi:hypothetical protein